MNNYLMQFLPLILFYFTPPFCESSSLETIINYSRKGNCDGMICDTYVCIPKTAICDHQNNCKDGTDEQFCPCPENNFQCISGDQCIPENLVCDGSEDCDDSSDEFPEQCHEGSLDSILCYEGMNLCDNDNCIKESQICDGVSDCDDQMDELFCDHQVTKAPIGNSNAATSMKSNNQLKAAIFLIFFLICVT